MSSSKMFSQVKDKNVKVKGNYNKNPILNTRVYNVMFSILLRIDIFAADINNADINATVVKR